jgi:hypothetical protein
VEGLFESVVPDRRLRLDVIVDILIPFAQKLYTKERIAGDERWMRDDR